MAVRKAKDGWVADVTLGKRLDGSRDRRQVTFKTKGEAEREERRLLMLKDAGNGKSYGGIPFGEFVDDYFWPQKTKLRGSTVKGYKRDLKLRLLPAFANRPVKDIDRYSIQKMISGCATKKVATNARETLSSILSLAQEMELIDVNPAGYHYQYPDAAEHDPDDYGVWLTSLEECREVMDWVHESMPGSPEERMVVLGLGFGLRKGEVLGLDWKDVDLKRRRIAIRRSYTKGDKGVELTPPKNENSKRTIPMTSYVHGLMSEWDRDDGPVVRGAKGGRMHPQTARNRISSLFADASFPDGEPVPRITQFSMRHSFGTSCIDAGIEVEKVSKWMGHVDTTVTMNRYVKPRLDDLYDAAGKMDAAMGYDGRETSRVATDGK